MSSIDRHAESTYTNNTKEEIGNNNKNGSDILFPISCVTILQFLTMLQYNMIQKLDILQYDIINLG